MNDAITRVLHTFWQALLGSLGAVWVASGIDVSQIKDIDAAKKAGLALVAALGAAALSAAKTAILDYFAQRKASAPAGPSPSGKPSAFADDPDGGPSFEPLSDAGRTGDAPTEAPETPPTVV